MNRKEKQELRAERYRRLAEKAEAKSAEAFNRSNAAVDGIVPGQPILVGHYSESRHHRAIERSHQAMDKCVQESNKAEYYRSKAESAEHNTNIYLGDDDAVERLTEKLAELEKKQESMKSANKILRSKKSDEDKVESLMKLGFSEKTSRNAVEEHFTFPAYSLSNNNARIADTRKKLEKAKQLSSMTDKEYMIDDCTVYECYSENRLRVFFPGKPSDDVRTKLKRNGFRWSPSNGCWQSYLNRWAIRNLKEIIQSV